MISRYGFFIYFVLLTFLTFILSKYPAHNGDMPFYIVCAIQMEGGRPENAVEKAKIYLKHELSPDEYTVHAGRIDKVDADYFDFYRIKPMYILAVFLFHKFGFPYTTATVLPSLICFFLIGITIWRFSIQYLDVVKAFLVSILCLTIYPSLILARFSTPDSMSCFFLLNALLFIYSGRQKFIWYSLLLLAVCTRLDNVITGLILLFAICRWPDQKFNCKLRIKEFACLSTILIALATAINFLLTQHFLRLSDPFFSRSSVGYIENVKWYLLALPSSFLMTLLILFVFTNAGQGFGWRNSTNYLIYVVFAIAFVRLLIYPFYEERFFSPFVIFGMLIISYRYSGVKVVEKLYSSKKV